MKEIDLDKLFDEEFGYYSDVIRTNRESMKIFVNKFGKQLLELAAGNAKMEVILDDTGELISLKTSIFKPHPYNKRLDENIHVNKRSILNTIKQVK